VILKLAAGSVDYSPSAFVAQGTDWDQLDNKQEIPTTTGNGGRLTSYLLTGNLHVVVTKMTGFHPFTVT
jgi:hypothetical protein